MISKIVYFGSDGFTKGRDTTTYIVEFDAYIYAGLKYRAAVYYTLYSWNMLAETSFSTAVSLL